MSLRPAPLKGRYRGRTSLLGLSPLVLFPLATGLLWAAVMLLLRLLPGSFVSRFLVPVSRLLSAPVKFVSSLLPFCLLELNFNPRPPRGGRQQNCTAQEYIICESCTVLR